MDCRNGGECFEGKCVCAKWFSGEECQLQYNRNYEGSYIGTYTDADRTAVETLLITADREIPNRLILPSGVYIEFVDEEVLTIPRQQLIEGEETIIVEGSGTYSTDRIQFSYVRHLEKEVISFNGARVE